MRDSQFPQFFWFYCVPPLSISLMVAALRNKAVFGFGLEVRVSFRRARYSHSACQFRASLLPVRLVLGVRKVGRPAVAAETG